MSFSHKLKETLFEFFFSNKFTLCCFQIEIRKFFHCLNDGKQNKTYLMSMVVVMEIFILV